MGLERQCERPAHDARAVRQLCTVRINQPQVPRGASNMLFVVSGGASVCCSGGCWFGGKRCKLWQCNLSPLILRGGGGGSTSGNSDTGGENSTSQKKCASGQRHPSRESTDDCEGNKLGRTNGSLLDASCLLLFKKQGLNGLLVQIFGLPSYLLCFGTFYSTFLQLGFKLSNLSGIAFRKRK